MTSKDKEKMKTVTEALKPLINNLKEKLKPHVDRISAYVSKNKGILKLILIIFLAMYITAHIKGCQEEMEANRVYPRPVQTTHAVKKDVPLYVDSFGSLSSPEDVDIKAQVTGKILEVNFEQGAEVAAGDLLFTIDPKEYKAEVEKAEGALAQDTATLALNKITLERNEQLVADDLISKQDLDQYQTNVTAAQAAVELDKANLELAEINLEYCYIRSPINGLAGTRQVDVGNIISANTGPVLVNVKNIDPLYLDFTLPERDLVEVRKAMEGNSLDIQITIPEEEGVTYPAVLQFVDNVVNNETGTFALRALVDNKTRALWAGQFVNIRLILGTEKDAVLVPYDATQIGKQGYYVFIIKKGNKADLRPVEVGSRQGDDIVIKKGIQADEVVVTAGQLGLSPGASIFDMTKTIEKKEAEAAKEKAKKK